MYSTSTYTRTLKAYPSVIVFVDEDDDSFEDTSEIPTASPPSQASSTYKGASGNQQVTRPHPTTFEPPTDIAPHRIEPEEDQMKVQLSP